MTQGSAQVCRWIKSLLWEFTTLREDEEFLDGQNKDIFINFVIITLQWRPKHRETGGELLRDLWLNNSDQALAIKIKDIKNYNSNVNWIPVNKLRSHIERRSDMVRPSTLERQLNVLQ
jgi:hypothetical protein